MYVNWDSHSKHVSILKWYKVDSIINYLHDTRTYITNTPGKFAINYFPKRVNEEVPVGRERRFPETEGWLCEGFGEWSVKYDRLILALNVAVYINRLERLYPDYKTPGEAEYYCLTVINELLQLFAAVEPGQVLRQSTFEQKYGLHWEEAQLEETLVSVKQNATHKRPKTSDAEVNTSDEN